DGVMATAGLDAGDEHTCAWSEAGAVWCWGGNTDGRLGLGMTPGATPAPREVLGLSGATSIAVGHSRHACATTPEGTFCWGKNFYDEDETEWEPVEGELGIGTTLSMPYARQPVIDENATPLIGTSLALAAESSALLVGDIVYRWGYNNHNPSSGYAVNSGGCPDSCGNQCTDCGLNARPVVDSNGGDIITGILDHAAGKAMMCIVRAPDLEVWCNGNDDDHYDTLGNGVSEEGQNQFEPYPVPVLLEGDAGTLDGVTTLAGNGHTTCAIRDDRQVWCWGSNHSGQRANGEAGGGVSPSPPMSSPAHLESGAVHEADRIAVGTNHVCTLNLDTKAIHCWGANGSGQLGLGPGAETKVKWATKIGEMGVGVWPADLVGIAAGGDHTCAVAEGGQVYCWGGNHMGQLGTGEGDLGDKLYPWQSSVTDATAIAAGA
ncbi:MAG: hypothetical protein QF464_20150, partial [Myxococcota bacterium]|nr:hypothetical protein [Myxococcota bacterium]